MAEFIKTKLCKIQRLFKAYSFQGLLVNEKILISSGSLLFVIQGFPIHKRLKSLALHFQELLTYL